MQLSAIKRGDIVRVNKKGREFLAFVTDKQTGAVELEPIERGISHRTATAREVTDHWARRGRARQQEAGQ